MCRCLTAESDRPKKGLQSRALPPPHRLTSHQARPRRGQSMAFPKFRVLPLALLLYAIALPAQTLAKKNWANSGMDHRSLVAEPGPLPDRPRQLSGFQRRRLRRPRRHRPAPRLPASPQHRRHRPFARPNRCRPRHPDAAVRPRLRNPRRSRPPCHRGQPPQDPYLRRSAPGQRQAHLRNRQHRPLLALPRHRRPAPDRSCRRPHYRDPAGRPRPRTPQARRRLSRRPRPLLGCPATRTCL